MEINVSESGWDKEWWDNTRHELENFDTTTFSLDTKTPARGKSFSGRNTENIMRM